MKKAEGDQTGVRRDGKQPAVITSQGIVRCAYCRTDEYGLSKGQESDDHIGVRFGNHIQVGFDAVWKWSIKLDGVEQMPQVLEALPGPEGYVVVYHTVPDLCGARRVICKHSKDLHGIDGAHPLIEKKRGVVTVDKVPLPTPEQRQADAEVADVERAADRKIRETGP